MTYFAVKKQITILVLVMFFIFPVISYSELRMWGVKGDYWNVLLRVEKLIYLYGVLDGLVFREKKLKIVYPESYGVYIDFLDKFYEKPLNRSIPAVWGIVIFSAEDRTKETLKLRKQFKR